MALLDRLVNSGNTALCMPLRDSFDYVYTFESGFVVTTANLLKYAIREVYNEEVYQDNIGRDPGGGDDTASGMPRPLRLLSHLLGHTSKLHAGVAGSTPWYPVRLRRCGAGADEAQGTGCHGTPHR